MRSLQVFNLAKYAHIYIYIPQNGSKQTTRLPKYESHSFYFDLSLVFSLSHCFSSSSRLIRILKTHEYSHIHDLKNRALFSRTAVKSNCETAMPKLNLGFIMIRRITFCSLTKYSFTYTSQIWIFRKQKRQKDSRGNG